MDDLFMIIISVVGIFLAFIIVFAIPVLISFITKIILEKKTKKQYSIRVYSMSLFIVFTLIISTIILAIIFVPEVALNSEPNPNDTFNYNPKLGIKTILFGIIYIPLCYFWLIKNIIKKVEPDYNNIELVDSLEDNGNKTETK